jgi:hypothetical protein
VKAWPVILLLALPFAACYAVGIMEKAPGLCAVLLFGLAIALVGREL